MGARVRKEVRGVTAYRPSPNRVNVGSSSGPRLQRGGLGLGVRARARVHIVRTRENISWSGDSPTQFFGDFTPVFIQMYKEPSSI